MFFPCVKIPDLFDTMQELPDFQLVQRGRHRVTRSALSEIACFPLSPPHAIDAIQGSEVLALVGSLLNYNWIFFENSRAQALEAVFTEARTTLKAESVQ